MLYRLLYPLNVGFWLICFGIVIAAFSWPQSGHTQLLIEINEGVTNPVPVAIVPFSSQKAEGLPGNLSEIITNDLMISGQFRLLHQKNMPDTDMIYSGRIGYEDWSRIRADYVLAGSIENTDGTSYKVRFELFDIVNRSSVVRKQMIFTKNTYRDTAHRISDLVYEQITGVRGVFSTKLAYVTVSGKNPKKRQHRLEISDSDGARAKVILKSFEPIMSPSWSPDSKKIAYVSFELGRSNVYVQNLETGERELFSGFRGINGSPAWSPDGQYLAVVLSRGANPDIHLINLSTKKVERLTRHPAIDTEPSWSSDSKNILFTSDRKDGVHIYEADVATKTIKRMTTTGKYNARARYTLQDTSFVMVSQDPDTKDYNIVSQNLVTGAKKLLSTSSLDESPSVSPNGSHIIFSTKRDGKSILVVVSVDLGIKYYLPYSRGEVRDPAWSPFVY